MRRIIKGKCYDTETARVVGCWDNSPVDVPSDFISAVLYCKRTGEYFIAWVASDESCLTPAGGDVVPLSFAEARRWAYDHLDPDGFSREFRTEPDAEEVISVRVPAAVKRALMDEVSATGKTQAEVVSASVLEWTRRKPVAAGGYSVAFGSAGQGGGFSGCGVDRREEPGASERSSFMAGSDVMAALGIEVDGFGGSACADSDPDDGMIGPDTVLDCLCNICNEHFSARADELMAGAGCPRCNPGSWVGVAARARKAWDESFND